MSEPEDNELEHEDAADIDDELTDASENDDDPDEDDEDKDEEGDEEYGDKFFDNLDKDERAGWEDNMNKD